MVESNHNGSEFNHNSKTPKLMQYEYEDYNKKALTSGEMVPLKLKNHSHGSKVKNMSKESS